MTDLDSILTYVKLAYSQWSPEEQDLVKKLATVVLAKTVWPPIISKDLFTPLEAETRADFSSQVPAGFIPYAQFCRRGGWAKNTVKQNLVGLKLLSNFDLVHGFNPGSSRANPTPHYVHEQRLLKVLAQKGLTTYSRRRAERALDMLGYQKDAQKQEGSHGR